MSFSGFGGLLGRGGFSTDSCETKGLAGTGTALLGRRGFSTDSCETKGLAGIGTADFSLGSLKFFSQYYKIVIGK